ncbi:MAG: alpha/beta hydrolase [Gemmatimonas sp.]
MASVNIERRTRRWQEQRWILDAIIRTVGPEWDQGRIESRSKTGGPAAEGDYKAAARRMRKFDDIHREFAAAARKREARAREFERQGRAIAARESYMAAAMLWASACWPVFEEGERLSGYEERMNACYAKYIKFAPHPIRRVEIPFGNKFLPAYLHLPRKPVNGEKFPIVFYCGGMDGSKENMVSLYGDRFMERGMAVLAIDGPGQAEAVSRGLYFTPENWEKCALSVYDFLSKQPNIDINKLVIRGSSFGSFWGTVAAATLGNKVKGYVTTGLCQEPGAWQIFNMASPTFKVRFMFMSGYDDEQEFDRFCKKIDLTPYMPKIKCPYAVITGENEQLSPLEYTEKLFELIKAPKRMVVYEGANHSVTGAPSAENGEDRNTMVADFLLDRANGKPMKSERIWIDSSGRATATPFKKAPAQTGKAAKRKR